MGKHFAYGVPSLANAVTLTFLLFIVTNVCVTSGSGAPPTIEVINLGEPWQNITGKEGAPSSGVNSVYAEKGSDLFLRCTANYPIQWKINGIITPPEVVKFQAVKRDLKKQTFQIQINIFFLEASNYEDLVASAIIACEQVDDSQNRDEFGVFVKGNKGYALFTPGDTRLEGDITLIPCFTSDPTASPRPALYYRGTNSATVNPPDTNKSFISDKLITGAIYNPTEGFRYAQSAKEKVFVGGIYTCRRGSESITYTVVDSSLSTSSEPSNGYYFAPVLDHIQRFSDESLEFKCSSKTRPVKLSFEPSSHTKVTFTSESATNKQAVLTRTQTSNNTQTPILKGITKCVETEGGKEKLLKEWSWEFVDAPLLYLDNWEGEVNCLSSVSPKIAQTVRCASGMECDFMGKTCLRDKSLCNFKRQKQFYGDRDTFCWVEDLRQGRPCAAVPFAHLNGLAKCGVMGLERRWEFFISLDYIRYTSWKDAPERELVRFEENSSPDDNSSIANKSRSKIVCAASAYLFADSLAFEIQYKNGTRSLLQEITSIETTPEFKRTRQILELNVKAVLDEELVSSDVASIDCLAPFWNSTEILRATKKL